MKKNYSTKKRISILLLLTLLLAIVVAQAQPVITTFAPASGTIGSSVTITGSGFNTTAAQNIVFFGATKATVTAATATSITVTVPLGATYQFLSVTNLAVNLTAYSAKPFIVTLAGYISFAAKTDSTTGTTPCSVSIGDLDGDGKPDLAMANNGSNTVSVLRNTSTSGTTSFATKVDFATGTNPYSVSIGDIDGDGKPDLAVTNQNGDNVSVLRNISTSGTVSFATRVDFTTGTTPYLVSIGDIDGDGKPDLAVANGVSSSVSVLRNISTPGIVSFATKVDFATGASPNSVSIGDIDGNGKPDLAVANWGSNTVSVLRNTSTSGTVSFATKVDFATGTNPISGSIGDIDGDGKADLAVTNFNSATLSVLRNSSTLGTVSFAAKVDLATGTNPRSVNIGDIDGNGKPDLAVANYGSNNVSVLRNTSTSGIVSFAAKIDYATGTNAISVSIGDIDGDGKPDMAVANYSSNTVSVIRQLGNSLNLLSFAPASGAIGSSVTITGNGFNTTLAQNIVFFGATQATVTAATATSLTVTVPLGATYQFLSVTNLAVNQTAYSAQPFIVTLAGHIAFAAKTDFTTGTNPYSVSIGDMDCDGKPDLTVANTASSTVSVLRNTSTSGTTSFATKVDFATGTTPRSVSIGDIDGDGKPDLAVANFGSNTVSVLRNTSTSGTMSFATKVDFATGTSPYSVSIGDIDGDGKPDLAVVNNSSNTVSVLPNTSTSGTISFAVKVDFATGTQPYSVSIGDIEGDGKPDLAVANFGSNTVSVLRNTYTSGTVSFATKVDFATGTSPYSVSIGDIDGDGKPDLAVACQSSNTVSVLRNISTFGTVSFATKVDFATGTTPRSVNIGDIDGDGKPDLAVANFGSNTVSVLRNTSISGTMSFATKADFATGTAPWSVSIGDIDGDGKPDLAVANNSSNTVSVIRQILPAITFTTFAPATGAIGSSVTITGTGFNNTAAQNIVFFGATQATVTAATDTSLTVTVPLGATYQYISVTNLTFNLTAYSTKPFIVTLAGSISFIPQTDFTTGTYPASVSIGDLDSDGKPDLAVANYGSDNVSVFLNTSTSGTVSFATKLDFATDDNPQSVSIGDIDGDGKPDLVVATYFGSKVSVLRNISTPGTLSFETRVDTWAAILAYSVSIGDIDGDGKPDLAVTDFYGNAVRLLRNTSTPGAVSFEFHVDFATGNSPSSVSIGDLDGDGKPDLAVANSGSSTVSAFLNTSTSGAVSFATKVDFPTGANPYSVSIGDIDGDGKPDLAVANSNSNTVSVLRNTSTSGAVSFATKVDFPTGASPYSVSIGDIDGNGKPDLATANDGSGTVSVLRNASTSGTVSFVAAVDFAAGGGPRSVSIGDIDGDGKPDMAVANWWSTSVSVIRQTIPVTFTTFAPATGAIGSSVTITGTGFNTTAAQNIVFFGATQATITAATATSLTVTVPLGATYQYLSVTNLNVNQTAYSAKPFIVTLAGNIAFEAKKNFTTGLNPSSISIGDIDGDGKPDLAVANAASGTVSVLHNTSISGTASFAAKKNFTTGATPVLVSIGDIDTDGKPDLAVANYGSDTISVLRNTSTSGTVSFATKVGFATGTNPYSVIIGDIDGDGKPDLAVANNNSNTVSVLRNTSTSGAVSFATKVDLATGTTPRSVSIGDIDGDGKPDLAVANYGGNTLSVFRNTSIPGTVSFATKVDFATSTNPISVSIGDIDGDGKPDLAVANNGSNSVSVIRNTSTSGTVSFATKVDFASGTAPFSVNIGDIDGDGKPDLAVANNGSNTVSVLRNTSTSGSVSFAAKVGFATGTNPASVSTGDIDGDGRPDLAVANYGSNTLSVLRQAGLSCIAPTVPTLSASSTTNCPSVITTLSIVSGILNDATSWQWYSGSCGGTPIGTGTSVIVSPAATTTYFARGEGGCVTPGSCSSITITVNPSPAPIITAGGSTTFCSGGSVTLSSTGSSIINQRYASTVINFSSEYTPTDWSANQTLGAPNVYPSYGSNPLAWSPNGNPREFITLAFANPSPINFIDIYETFNLGAIDTVYVKNPATGLFEVVYSTTAGSIGNNTARILHISFPVTTFNVSEIRIAINDAAIGTWNEIDAVAIGMEAPFSFLWSTGATTQTISVNTSGTFTVTVTNASGCTGTASVTTSAMTAPVITGDLTFCPGSSTLLSTGFYSSYLWSTGAITQTISVNTGATFTVTVTNANGCIGSASAQVTKKVKPTVTVTPTAPVICPPNVSVSLAAGGTASTYAWSPATGLNQTVGASVTASPAATTTYIVTGTSTAGCTATKTATVTVKPKPVNLSTTNITASSAKANWSMVSCAVGYKLQYRKQGVTTWTTANITTNNPTKTISGLLAATTYQWRVSSKFADGTFSAYSTIVSFTTLVLRNGMENIESNNELVVYPNPADDKLNLEFPVTDGDANISFVNSLGQTVLVQKVKTTDEAIVLNIESLPAGLYFIAVQNGGNTFNSRFIKN